MDGNYIELLRTDIETEEKISNRKKNELVVYPIEIGLGTNSSTMQKLNKKKKLHRSILKQNRNLKKKS